MFVYIHICILTYLYFPYFELQLNEYKQGFIFKISVGTIKVLFLFYLLRAMIVQPH
jgi:hypothetical protein